MKVSLVITGINTGSIMVANTLKSGKKKYVITADQWRKGKLDISTTISKSVTNQFL